MFAISPSASPSQKVQRTDQDMHDRRGEVNEEEQQRNIVKIQNDLNPQKEYTMQAVQDLADL